MSKSIIQLSLTNNTSVIQPISLMNQNPEQITEGSGNAMQNSYTYDVTNEINLAIVNNFTYITVLFSVNNGQYKLITITLT